MLVIAQLAFIAFWIHTFMPALNSRRIVLRRLVVVCVFGWLQNATDPEGQGSLSLVCNWLITADLISIFLAVWNRDFRFFTHRHLTNEGR